VYTNGTQEEKPLPPRTKRMNTVATENQSYTQNIEEQEGPIFLALDAGIELPFGRNLYLPVGAFFNYAIGNIPDDTSLLELGVKAGIQYRY
jgi:hypothetical protein